MTYYEVDLRNRATGESTKTIYSGTNHTQAYIIAAAYNVATKYNNDGNTGLFADVIHIDNPQEIHGTGTF